MKVLLLMAAGICFATAALHVIAGGDDIMRPVMDSGLSQEVKYTIASIWHFVTLFLVIGGIVLVWQAFGTPRTTAPTKLVLLLNLGFGLIFLQMNLAAFGQTFALPQWTLFFAISGLAISALALRNGEKQS